jgi:DNA-directed RNA polymerase specialized sigma24 family protein
VNDEECLRSIAQGGPASQQAIAVLFRRYYSVFVAFLLRRRVTREDAEDLVQDVFVNLARSLVGSSASIADGRAYLFAALRNRFLDHVRVSGRFVSESELTPASGPGSTTVMERLMQEYAIEPDDGGLLRTHGATREFLSQTIKRFRKMLISLCPDFLPNNLRRTP